MNETPPTKNAAAVALGKMNAGKPRRQSPELRARRVELAAHARACKLAKQQNQQTPTAVNQENAL